MPYGAAAVWSTGSNAKSITADTGSYWVTVTDGKCIGSDTINIHTQMCNCTGNAPNAFTPNGDGKNDFFHMIFEAGCPVNEYSCKVYNRWGNLVFSSADPQGQWDGNYHGVKADAGAYMYEVQFIVGTDRQDIRRIKGDVVLIR